MMGPSVAHGLPRCDSPAQEEALLRILRLEYGAAGAAWVENGTPRKPRAALGVRAWLGSVVRPLRRERPASPTFTAQASAALAVATVVAVQAGSDSATACTQPCES